MAEKARDAGIIVITLDMLLDPVDAADALFATDNFKAGELIGQWSRPCAWRQGGKRQDRHAHLDGQSAVSSTICVTTVS